MLRISIDVSRDARQPFFDTRDAIHNVLTFALVRHGYHPVANRPSPWGFGVVGRRVRTRGPRRLWRVERIVVGTTEPTIAEALARITPDDLVEPSQVPSAGLDLRQSTLRHDVSWFATSALSVYALSPIRVLERTEESHQSMAILTLGPQWDAALNRTMATRFGRPFQLRVVPDEFYVRAHQGHLVAKMGIKKDRQGRPVILPGLVFPFLLLGPESDLRDAWFNGIGAGTGMGFGCLEVSEQ
ncbi:MAG: hypothetical protein OWR62_10140 [Sulfobacillus thermotolerans]|nr:hypothetical protein [Sulfobacillus thermotolerans]